MLVIIILFFFAKSIGIFHEHPLMLSLIIGFYINMTGKYETTKNMVSLKMN